MPTSQLEKAVTTAILAGDPKKVIRAYNYGASFYNLPLTRVLSSPDLAPMLQFLLNAGYKAKPEQLRTATLEGNVEAARILLKDLGKSALADEVNFGGMGHARTYLCYALENKNVDMTKLFVAENADVCHADSDKNLPIHYALASGVDELIEIIEAALKHSPATSTIESDAEELSQFESAVREADTAALKNLVDEGFNLNKKRDLMPLQVVVNTAYHEDKAALADFLLGLGADPHLPNTEGFSSFEFAVSHLDIPVVHAITGGEADMLSDDNRNFSKLNPKLSLSILEQPLAYALRCVHHRGAAFVAYLLNAGVGTSNINILEESASKIAFDNQFTVALRMLEAYEESGKPPIINADFAEHYAAALAVEEGNLSMLESLQGASAYLPGIAVGQPYSCGYDWDLLQVLAYAPVSTRNGAEVLELLKKVGVEWRGEPVLEGVVANNKAVLLPGLLKWYSDVNGFSIAQSADKTNLMSCAMQGLFEDIIDVLIEQGATPDAFHYLRLQSALAANELPSHVVPKAKRIVEKLKLVSVEFVAESPVTAEA